MLTDTIFLAYGIVSLIIAVICLIYAYYYSQKADFYERRYHKLKGDDKDD